MFLNIGELSSYPGKSCLNLNSVGHGSSSFYLGIGDNESDCGLVLSEISSILPLSDFKQDILSLLVELLDFSIKDGISLRVVMSLSYCGEKSESWNSGEFGKHWSNFSISLSVLTLLTLVKL